MVIGQRQHAGIEGGSMRQQIATHETGNALSCALVDRRPTAFDAVPQQTQSSEDAIIFADVCRQLAVNHFVSHQREVPPFKLFTDCWRVLPNQPQALEVLEKKVAK